MKKNSSSADIALSIAQTNGNSFHYKVVDWLKQNGWSVLVSPYYSDLLTAKPREIDIVAEKRFGPLCGRKDRICVRLFVECKYITKEGVFWFDDKDLKKAKQRIMDETHLDEYDYEQHHYYAVKEVAKLFASEPSSQEGDIIFKAVNQSLSALLAYRDNGLTLIEDENIVFTINCPVIVCNKFEKFYKEEHVTPIKVVSITDNFQLEVNYAYQKGSRAETEYFLIDVVEFSKLSQLIDFLNKESSSLLNAQDYASSRGYYNEPAEENFDPYSPI